MLWLIPIEPYEERYTECWYRWFPDMFDGYGVEYNVIDGAPLQGGNTIKDGCVLDVTGTNYYKFSQLKAICEAIRNKEIKDGDILFFTDLWFPGIEAIPYMCSQLGLKIKIAGIMHAGTYDVNDFTFRSGMNYWGKDLENSWFKFFDYIFVGSQYHKDLILSTRECDAKKIFVTGLPQVSEEVRTRAGFNKESKKENIVVFPSRLDAEKQPNVFRYLGRVLTQTTNCEFVICKDVCKTKDEYYQLLVKAKVVFSASLQETFGYGVLEAVTLGCIPVLPNRLCYPEMYPTECLYNSFLEAGTYIKDAINRYDSVYTSIKDSLGRCVYDADFAIARMLAVLGSARKK